MTQLLFSNTEFSTQEQSVFENNNSTKPMTSPTLENSTDHTNEVILDKPIQSVQENTENMNISNTINNDTSPKINEEINEVQSEQTIKQKHDALLENDTTTDNEFQTEQSLFGDNVYQTYEPQINYFEEVILQNRSDQKNIYLSYVTFPKNIYFNQRFEIAVKALITTEEFDRIETRFINDKNMTALNPARNWEVVNNNTLENKYYFKAFDPNFTLPTFQVVLYKNNEVLETAYLKPQEVNFSVLGEADEKFSSVVAKNLKVNAFKSKQYNNSELIAILDIEAFESNLEDFHLKNIEEQGFSNINDEYPRQQMLYYVVLPIHHKKIEFNYFNTQKQGFEKITIPVILENELVSTQTDLNPNNSNLLFYKKVALAVLSGILLVLFIWKRKYVYGIALIIVLAVLIYYLMPHAQAYVKQNATIYILPTKNSTIFYSTSEPRVAQVIMKKANFVKIIIEKDNKKIIGWIKEENLVEN
jgi:hypothetical protein